MVTSQVNMSSVGGVMVHPAGGLLVISPSSCNLFSCAQICHTPAKTNLHQSLVARHVGGCNDLDGGRSGGVVASDVSRVEWGG